MTPFTTPASDDTSRDDARADAARSDAGLVLSRLVDGDCDGSVTPRACALWQADEAVRQTWHSYHLIGDVLRAQDLQATPRRERAFIEQLRERLAAEPPIVAPLAPLAQAAATVGDRLGPRRRWLMPAAAGFAGVAAVAALVAVQLPQRQGDAPVQLASNLGGQHAGGPPLASSEEAAMIRDARIDMYLRAHHTMRNSAAAAMPGGALRNVDMLLPGR